MSTALKQLSRISLESATNLAKTVQVVWADGSRAEFPYCWLRDISKNSRPSLIHLDVNTRPKNIECTSNSLRVTWPPFMTYSFSSEFLREHAINHPTTNDSLAELATDKVTQTNFNKPNNHLNNQLLYKIISSNREIDEKLIMGSFDWQERAREPGTIWPHLNVVPSLCIVESLKGKATLTIVDTFHALTLLEERVFKCLSKLEMEYAEGLFCAKHPIFTTITTNNGKIINSAVFNNALRSSVITTDAMLKLESLHKFGRVCAELAQTVILNPGERLIVNNKMALLGAPAEKGRYVSIKLMS